MCNVAKACVLFSGRLGAGHKRTKACPQQKSVTVYPLIWFVCVAYVVYLA